MKKLLFLALSMLIALPTMADDEVKSWNFTNNEEGECVIDVVIPTEKDQVAAIKAVKVAINKITLSGRNLLTIYLWLLLLYLHPRHCLNRRSCSLQDIHCRQTVAIL